MKHNRIPILCIALLLMVQLLSPLACAAGTTLTLTGPDALPAVGQTFTITVDLTGNPGLNAVQLKLGYDDAVLECTGVETGALVSGMLSATNPHGTRGGTGAILAAAGTNSVKKDGQLAVFTFKVKASGDAKLSIADTVISNADGGEIAFTYSLTSLVSQGSSSGTGSDSGSDKDEKTDDAEKPGETVTAGSFRDVPGTHWAFASVQRAVEMGLVTGYADGTFHPDTPVTRAQFVLMLWRMAGKPAAAQTASFTDTANGSWYRDALDWAVENGYVNGLSAAAFGPDAPITRQQATAILFRFSGGQSGAELMLTGIYEQSFTDSASIASWAKDAVWWAVYHELVSGVGGSRIAPEANASRAQIAAILLRYADKFMTNTEEAA